MVRLKLRVKVLPQEQLSPSKSRLAPPATATPQYFLHIVPEPENFTLGELADTIKVRYEKLFQRKLEIKKLVDDLHDADELDADLTVADVFIDLGKARVDPSDQWATVRVIQKPSQNAPQRYMSVVQDWTAPSRPPVPLFPGVLGRRRRDEFENSIGLSGGGGKRRRTNADADEDRPVSSIEREEPENNSWNRTRRWSQNGETNTRPGMPNTPQSYDAEQIRPTEYHQVLEVPDSPSGTAARPSARGMALPSDEAYDTKSESPGAPDVNSFPPTPENEEDNRSPREASILPGLRAAAQDAMTGAVQMPTPVDTSNAPSVTSSVPAAAIAEQCGTPLQARHPILPLPTSKTQSSGKLNRPFKLQLPTKPFASARTSTSDRRGSSVNGVIDVPSGSEHDSAQEEVGMPPRKRRMGNKGDRTKNGESNELNGFQPASRLQLQFPELGLPAQRKKDAAPPIRPSRTDRGSSDAVPGANEDENELDVDDGDPQAKKAAANQQDESAYDSESDRRREAEEALQAQVDRETQEEDMEEAKRLRRNEMSKEYKRRAVERKRLEAEKEETAEASGSEFEAGPVSTKKIPRKNASKKNKDANELKPSRQARGNAKGNDGTTGESKLSDKEAPAQDPQADFEKASAAIEKQPTPDQNKKDGKQKEAKPRKPRRQKKQDEDSSKGTGAVIIPDSQPPVEAAASTAKSAAKRGRKKKADENEDPVVDASARAIMSKQLSNIEGVNGTANLLVSGKGRSNINLDLLNDPAFKAKAMKTTALKEKAAQKEKDKEGQRSSVQSVDSVGSAQPRRPSFAALPLTGKKYTSSSREEPSPGQEESPSVRRGKSKGGASKATDTAEVPTIAEASTKPSKAKKTPKVQPTPPIPKFSETTPSETRHTPILPPGFDPKISEELENATSSQEKAIFSRMFGTSVTDDDIRSATEKARTGSSALRSESPAKRQRRGSRSDDNFKRKDSMNEVEDGTTKVSAPPKKRLRLFDPPSWSFLPTEAENGPSNDGSHKADGAAPESVQSKTKTDDKYKTNLKPTAKEKKEPKKKATSDSKKQSTLTDTIIRGKGKQKVVDPPTPLKLTSQDDPIILSDEDDISIHSQHSDSDDSVVRAGPSNRVLTFERRDSEQKSKPKSNSFGTTESSKNLPEVPTFSNGKFPGATSQDTPRDQFRSKHAAVQEEAIATPALVDFVNRPTNTSAVSGKKTNIPASKMPQTGALQIFYSDDGSLDRAQAKSPTRPALKRRGELAPDTEEDDEEGEEEKGDHENEEGSADAAARVEPQAPLRNLKTKAPTLKPASKRAASLSQGEASPDGSKTTGQSKLSPIKSTSNVEDESDSESDTSHQLAQPTALALMSPTNQVTEPLSQAAESKSESGSETGDSRDSDEEDSEEETSRAIPVKTSSTVKMPEVIDALDPGEFTDSEDDEEESLPKAITAKQPEPKIPVAKKKPESTKPPISKPKSISQTETDSDTGSEEESRSTSNSESESESESESSPPPPPKATTSSLVKNPFVSKAAAKNNGHQSSSQPTFSISSQSQYRSTLADLKKSISGTGTPTQAASGRNSKPAATADLLLESLKDLSSEESASEDEEESSGTDSNSEKPRKEKAKEKEKLPVKKSALPTPNPSSQNKTVTPKEGGSAKAEKSAKKLANVFPQPGRRPVRR